MIHQMNLEGKDKVEVAIERIQNFEKIFKNDEGYYLAFSGGKDSVVVKRLIDMAGVKYDAHYNITTVDPPELVRFIKREYPDVSMDRGYWEKDGVLVKRGDPITMWNLIPERKTPPTRLARYCCKELKESGGDGRLTVTGVRWAESTNRKANQGLVTVMGKPKENKQMVESGSFRQSNKGGVVLTNDNEDSRLMIEQCYQRRKTVLNPIIDWDDDDVWEFIREYNVPYCELYDQGFKRLGCIGCPMGGGKVQRRALERWPKYKQAYFKAFERMLRAREMSDMKTTEWKTPEEVMKWWTRGQVKE